MGNTPNFTQIRERTIRQRDQRLERFIPIFQKILTATRITPERIEQITRLDIVALVAQLNKRTITSEQLVAIFGSRAATIGRKNCIITQDYFEYALKRANECDQQRAKTGKLNWTLNDEWDMNKFFPPLFGIPTSIKDNIEMEGTRSTIGLTIRADTFLKQDCGTIKCFKHTGLIPFIKTNVPQLAFNFDSANHLWGRTLNPWNLNKSAGGSSGGEGAAIASRVSPIGIGNDMGGSIRIPAAFNGVFGLLVSGDRLPFKGQMTKYSTGFTGMDTIKAVNGPLSKSVDSLALWLRQMTIQEFYLGQHDAYKKLIPFDFKLYRQISQKKGKYRIGVIQSFQIIEPTPANRRALRQTVKFLENEGHTAVQIAIPHQQQLLLAFFGELVGEGGFASFACMLQGQKLMDEYSSTEFFSNRGWLTHKLLKGLISCKYPRLGTVVQACRNMSTHEYLVNIGRIHEIKDQWIKYWRQQKLDFVVIPGFATEAPSHGGSKDGSLFATYTYVFNLLGMVSVSQPITVTRADELHYESDWEDPVTQLIRTNLKDAQGLPVSIQVIGLPFQEERVLGLSKRIEQYFKFYQHHPLPNL